MAHRIVKRGSVVLVRYPFTDLTSTKVRPAVVFTPDWLLPKVDEVICLFVSSVMPQELLPTDFVFEKEHVLFSASGLKKRSVFRAHKLAVLHRSLVLRILGELEIEIMREIEKRVQIALGIRPPQEAVN